MITCDVICDKALRLDAAKVIHHITIAEVVELYWILLIKPSGVSLEVGRRDNTFGGVLV